MFSLQKLSLSLPKWQPTATSDVWIRRRAPADADLEFIFFTFNGLGGWAGIGLVTRLEVLSVSGNPMHTPPLDLIERGMDELRGYLVLLLKAARFSILSLLGTPSHPCLDPLAARHPIHPSMHAPHMCMLVCTRARICTHTQP